MDAIVALEKLKDAMNNITDERAKLLLTVFTELIEYSEAKKAYKEALEDGYEIPAYLAMYLKEKK